MAIALQYQIWLTSYAVERLALDPKYELSSSDFSLTGGDLPMDEHGYRLVASGAVPVQYTPNREELAAYAVGKLEARIAAEHAAFNERIQALQEQINRFQALPFNPSEPGK